MVGILLAVDRSDMRGIFVQIRPSNSKLAAVQIDPLPESLA